MQDPFEWENVQGPLTLTLQCMVAYVLGHVLVERVYVRPFLCTAKQWDAFSRHQRINLVGKYLSAFNAIIVGSAGFYCCVIHPQFEGTRGIFYTYPALFTVIFSSYVGYTLYDMLAMLVAGNEHWTMWLHHLVGGLGAFLMMLYRRAAYFPIFFTMSELSVVPTNWVWVLRTLKVDPRSARYRVAHTSRSLSFLMFRSFLGPACLYYAWLQIEPGRESVWKWRVIWQEMAALPWIIVAGTSFNVLFLTLLNLWWTLTMGWNIVRKLFVRKGGSKVDEKDE